MKKPFNHIFRMGMIALVIIFSCTKSSVRLLTENQAAYQEYISGYSGGELRRDASFLVTFAKEAVPADQVGQSPAQGAYKIEPGLNGTMTWKSTNTLEFIPDRKALRGQVEYKMILDLKKIFPEISNELRQVAIPFQYEAVKWIAQWSFPRADKNQPGSLYLTGVISVNEELNAERLQKSISAKSSDGENMKVMVEPSSVDPDAFEIRIHPISRKEKAYDLLLEWETSSEDGASRKKNLSYRIPSVSEFAVMGIDDSKAAAGSLQVFFSDPLAEDQDISGLVKLKGETAVLQLVKESDLIRVSLPEAYAAEAGTLLINESIRSVGGMSLRAEYQHVFQLKQIKPQVRITDKGSILPYSDKVILPFEAINLHTVEVEVFKTFSNNVLHHLHFGFDSDYDSYNMVRLGRVVKQKVFRLEDLAPGSNAKEWKRYGIDISELIQAESGAYYQIRIGFKPEHSNYACTGDKPEIPEDFYDENSGDPDIYSFWREYPYYDYREGADYDPEDPCRLSYYYRAHFAKVSLLASNIAMIVKSAEAGSQQLAFVYDILDGTPVKGAEVSWYDPQLQLLTTQKTDGLGMVERKGAQLPAFAVAKYGKHFSYLKVADGRSLSLSEFDVSGVQMQDGLKASLYTERGVWRPGDTICLNAILHQFGTPIPDRFPVVLTVTNPRGQVVYNKQLSEHLMGLFTFQIPTGESDLTGLYKASLKAGLSEFEKNLLVETVKPNRFKVEWPLQSQTPLSAFAKGIQMKAAWLHGSPASGAHANVQLRYKMVAPVFKQYAAYNFVDPEYQSITGEINLYDGELDESGEAVISSSVLDGLLKTGKLHTTLISKISAADGDISTDYMDTEVATFKEFVGIKMPESPYGRQLTAGTDHEVKILVVDEKGNPLPNRKVQLELYQVSYEWWYELRNAYRSDYQRQDYKTKLKTAQLTTDQNGLATYVLNVGEYDRFYLNVTHMGNKYSAGVHFYTGWAYDRNQTEFVNILKFKANKEVYQIGDEAVIELPGAARGRYLINLLRGNRVVKHQTIEAQQGQTVYKFALTAEMAPNIYVDVTYLQGKDQKNNDLPLRLYGVLPVRVEDPSRKLLPKISMPDQLRPDEKFSVEVSEEQSRTMAYQLFIVDEGLLNLTRFKTPDPYQDMMAKEALTMMTWDNFNEVIGGSNAGLEKIFSIGGDLAAKAADEEKNKRFNPVVLRAGPFTLKKGERRKHEFVISNYIGSVRVMLIANETNAFGSTDKSVPVRRELMAQLTAPRVFSIGDEVLVPVTIFATDPNVKNVQVTLSVKGRLELLDPAQKQIRFDRTGDQTVFYRVKGTRQTGNAELLATATSGSYSANSSIAFYVDNPNPVTHESKSFWVEPGKQITESIAAYGTSGPRTVRMEVSGIPGLSIRKMVDQLIRYPHGCLEQTISSAFPQMVLSTLLDLNADQNAEITTNLQAAMDKIRRFQLSDGSFSYWPGMPDYSDWNTTYAGQFLIEAKNSGFRVPEDVLQKWYVFERSRANGFTVDKRNPYARPYLHQAFRLYVLALFGKPEWSAMNQLYQLKTNDIMTNVLLAASFAKSGKKDMADALYTQAGKAVAPYREHRFSYGSSIRDEAFIAQLLVLMNKESEAAERLSRILKQTGGQDYLNTQEMSMVLLAVSRLYGKENQGNNRFSYSWNGKKVDASKSHFVYETELIPSPQQLLEFTNHASAPVSVTIIQTGKEDYGAAMQVNKGLNLTVRYVHEAAGLANLVSGDPVMAEIIVSNPATGGRIDNIAMTAVFPGGLEIDNRRIGGIEELPSGIDFQDFRDDRVMSYMSLNAGEQKIIRIPLTAAYAGKYSAPAYYCEAMYDPSQYARYRSGSLQIRSRK